MRIVILQDTKDKRTHTYKINDPETMEILDNLIHKMAKDEIRNQST